VGVFCRVPFIFYCAVSTLCSVRTLCAFYPWSDVRGVGTSFCPSPFFTDGTAAGSTPSLLLLRVFNENPHTQSTTEMGNGGVRQSGEREGREGVGGGAKLPYRV